MIDKAYNAFQNALDTTKEEHELELLAFLHEEGLISNFLKWKKDFKKLPRNQQTATFTTALHRLRWWQCSEKLKR